MRIAVNTRFLLPGKLEGIGYFTREVCRRLPAAIPGADFLFCFDRPFDPALAAHPRVRGVVVPPPARDPLLWKIWFDYSLPRAVSRWGADILLHLDGYCSLRTGTPQVMVLHDIAHVHYPDEIPGRVRRYYDKYIPRFLDRADRILTVSQYVKEDIIRTYGTATDKISVSCNGVRPEFRPLSRTDREGVKSKYSGGFPYFFYVGAIHPRKNVARLIRAYGEFRQRNPDRVKLLLGGRMAWQTGEIRAAYADSPYREDIHFLGYLEESELVSVLASSLALVYPSLSEGFGVPLLEAMYAGVPIVTSNRSSLPEVAGPAALLADPLSVSSIAEALVRIAGEAGLAERLVAAGYEQRQRYSWDLATAAIVDQLLAVHPPAG